jgi:hypothetical protein
VDESQDSPTDTRGGNAQARNDHLTTVIDARRAKLCNSQLSRAREKQELVESDTEFRRTNFVCKNA